MSRTLHVPIHERTWNDGWYSSRRPGPGGMAWKCKDETHRAERRFDRHVERESIAFQDRCRGCAGAGCFSCDYSGRARLADLVAWRGRRLKALRQSSGIGFREFAVAAGLTPEQLSEAEAGRIDASDALGRLVQGRLVLY